MKGLKKNVSSFYSSYTLGLFLAVRDIKRSNLWTTVLIISIMTLTFLNLVVVRGVLVGLVEGSNQAYRHFYIGDDILQTPRLKTYIKETPYVLSIVSGSPWLSSYSPRYLAPVLIESGYRDKIKTTDQTETVNALAAGINPLQEEETTGLQKKIIAGSFISPDDVDGIDIGASLLYKYTPTDSPSQKTLKGADVGSKVRITIGNYVREVTIRGVYKTKVDAIDRRILMPASVVREMLARSDYGVDEISIKTKTPDDTVREKNYLVANGVDTYATVSTFDEGVPKFVKDINITFNILSNLISSIGLVVAAITIFIVIFVNAITRRKYIGILKGIGVTGHAIEISYTLQALFYASVGISIGSIIVFGFLKPFFAVHTIDFPFGDGILVADPLDVAIRSLILFIATAVAGFIPARIVVKQNTLDAILGR